MTLKVWNPGEKLDADDLNENFNELQKIGTGSVGNSNIGAPTTSFTTLITTDFQSLALNKKVFHLHWSLFILGGSGGGTCQFLITFIDDTTEVINLGTYGSYGRPIGSYSGTKQIKTVEWQARRDNGSASIVFVSSGENGRGVLSYSFVGEY